MPFLLDVGRGLLSLRLSPLKPEMGKQTRSQSEKDPQEGKAKQLKCDPQQEPLREVQNVENQPSSKEIAAALAARARLYGGAVESTSGCQSDVGKLPDGPEPAVPAEIIYTPSEELVACPVTEADTQEAVEQMNSSDWVAACRGLVTVRQLALHHHQMCCSHLDILVPLVVKLVKSLRTSVCKMAILATADLFSGLQDEMLPHMDRGGAASPANSLLAQLLLKGGSNDKRFVIDEVQRALDIMTQHVNAAKLMEMLLPYAAHKGPKVRGKVASTLAATVSRLSNQELGDDNQQRLLKVAAKLVADNTPEAREGARQIISCLRSVHMASAHHVTIEVEEKENCAQTSNAVVAGPPLKAAMKKAASESSVEEGTPWAVFCRHTLGQTGAGAVLRAA